jgi:transcription elongation factor GreA
VPVTSDRGERLTRAQKQRLEEELAELEGPRRAEMVEAIATARGFGDLSENFEYHAAKNEQGLLERRITMLRARVENAVLIDEEAAAASKAVVIGSKVEFEDEDGERMEVEISSAGGVSPDSPLGRALLGAHVGDQVDVEAPRGSWRAKVVSIGRA